MATGYDTPELQEGPDPMDETEFEAIVSAAIEEASSYIDEEVAPSREDATVLYRMDPLGNEEEGRSQVQDRTVADVVGAIMPSLMKIFFSSEKVCEFIPRGPEDVPSAEAATDYVNYILTQDNSGFLAFYSAFKDALIRRTGVIKYAWTEEEKIESQAYSGLGEQELAVLLDDRNVDELSSSVEGYDDPDAPPTEDGQPGQYYNAMIRRRWTEGRVKVEPVPPEEFLISRDAKSAEDAYFVGHRRYLTISELVQMGYDPEEMKEHAGTDHEFMTNTERQARLTGTDIFTDQSQVSEAARKVLYTECYLREDYDGDGITELRRVCTVGTAHKIVMNQPCNYVPFTVFVSDPEPHTWDGLSITDTVKDIQVIKTAILRNTLDSLALAIHPRMVVQDGMVDYDSVMNSEIGAIIKTRTPGAVQPLAMPFVGQQAFPMLDYMDNLRESRTGITKASQGLDPDSLQSSTRAAVAATISAAQAKIEMIARIFAECAVKPLMKGILSLVVQHQDQPRMIRLRGQFVPMDPRAWDTSMDVAVNVGLGDGDSQSKLQILSMIAQKQEQIIQTVGIENPLVNIQNYYNTLSRMVELSGNVDVSQFLTNPATYEPPPPQEPKKSPEELLAEVQMQEIHARIQTDAVKIALEREKMEREDDRKRDEHEADVALRAREIEAKYATTVDTATIRADSDREREVLRRQTELDKSAMNQQPPMIS